jgi:hypothetical protein
MAYSEDLYNRLTSGMVNSDQYLAKLSDRGQPSEAEMAALRKATMTDPMMQSPRSLQGQPMPSQAEMEALQRSMMGQAPQSQMQGMGGMTPEETNQYLQSFTDAGINLTPGAGIARGLLNMDQAITNATTAPNVLQQNQLQNIAGGQSNVSPYGLGLGQQMYNPEMLRGLLGF